MKIYIDSEYKCHVSNDGTMREFDLSCFDGKCQGYIEGFMHIPEGEEWISPEEQKFTGQVTFAWKNYDDLAAIQSAVDKAQEKSDEQIMELLDVIEELIIGG